MELADLLAALAQPCAYPGAVEDVEVRQTHISVVFLAGAFAYKIKKPVHFAFVDFRTLEQRHHFCQEEVRLNRRLAPQVYRGVVPITQDETGLHVEGSGAVIEWAVKMQRLPEAATLEQRLRRGEVGTETIRRLAEKIAAFHAQAETNANIAALGRFAVVAGHAMDNFTQVRSQVGSTLSAPVYERLQSLTEEALTQSRCLIEQRAAAGVPRDTHGDLHLDHVYLLPSHSSAEELVIIDCIEFNPRFRFADPVADMTFLVMDLLFHGRRDLAADFSEAYFAATQDAEGRALLPFYVAYRAAVRGKVEGLELMEREVPEAERTAASTRARAHWLLALGTLEAPLRRPCLVLVGGLPGSGKSTLAAALAQRAGFQVIRSDVVRKELAPPAMVGPAGAAFEGDRYTAEWTERTYAECQRRAEELLFQGQRVLVDATFRAEKMRQRFLDCAERWAVPCLLLVCQAEPEVVRHRLAGRRGDASDADWQVYVEAAARWEEPAHVPPQMLRALHTGGELVAALAQAWEALRGLGVADEGLA